MIWCSKPRGFVRSRIKRPCAFHGPFNLTGLKVCVCVRVFIFVHIYIYIYLYMCMFAHMYLFVYMSVFMFVYLCILMCVYVCVYVCMCLCVCDAGHLSSTEEKYLYFSRSTVPLCLSWFVLYSFSTPFMSFLPDESRLDWQPVAMRPW